MLNPARVSKNYDDSASAQLPSSPAAVDGLQGPPPLSNRIQNAMRESTSSGYTARFPSWPREHSSNNISSSNLTSNRTNDFTRNSDPSPPLPPSDPPPSSPYDPTPPSSKACDPPRPSSIFSRMLDFMKSKYEL